MRDCVLCKITLCEAARVSGEIESRADWWFNYQAIHFHVGGGHFNFIVAPAKRRFILDLFIQLTLYCNLICYNFVSCILVLQFDCLVPHSTAREVARSLFLAGKATQRSYVTKIYTLKKSNWKWEKLDEMTFLIKNKKASIKVVHDLNNAKDNETFSSSWGRKGKNYQLKSLNNEKLLNSLWDSTLCK